MTKIEKPEIDLDEAAKRAALYAETIGAEPPSKLIDDDGAPTPELGTFCLTYGASLDWIFLGDPRGMIHDSYRLAPASGKTGRSIHTRLCAALGIVQREILAAESNYVPESVFGGMVMGTAALEEAAHILAEVIPETENLTPQQPAAERG